MSSARSAWKYRLKRDGLASALLQPKVQSAFPHIPSAPVALPIFEWSGMLDQRLMLSWTLINSPAALTGAADRLPRTGGAEHSHRCGARLGRKTAGRRWRLLAGDARSECRRHLE
ncbi:DUF1194 domain-containing protein [Rhodovulum sulfidophilum]|uniref:DUF1194 domain-containing protein n=1 Tax=Rhodovulum sulfidophilum TaxID=35806 RepID=UPI0013896530|nr:DUF1194 domain-containing protein [Rhodovulum sulfidophilum]NDK36632.1 DUF1194 domain-containing protein [Rhodovulum sulfidophilum]